MKWYKQDTKSHTDEKIRELIHCYGLEGYGVYIILLELIAEKIDHRQCPEIKIDYRVLKEILHISDRKITKILRFFHENSMVLSIFSEGYWNLKCPNLLKRLDNWTKRSVVTTEQPSAQQEEEQEEEREKKKRIAFTPPTLEEVSSFVAANSLSVDSEVFHNHYTSNGWKIGRVSMKNWQATLKNWARREKNQTLSSTKKEDPWQTAKVI